MTDNKSPEVACANMRKLIVESIGRSQTGHLGSSLSLVEILYSVLKSMQANAKLYGIEYSQNLILSKGHGAPALYAALAEFDFIQREEVLTSLRRFGSRLQGHPSHQSLSVVAYSTGSLGQGLSVGLGIALARKIKDPQNQRKIFCVVGDGEMQEGQIWEALCFASAKYLNNVVLIIDRNGLQNDGPTEEIMPLDALRSRIESFNWHCLELDGHSVVDLLDALELDLSAPLCIIANTVKGKGVSFMEGVVKWHHHPLNPNELNTALEEIGYAATNS